MNPVDVALFCTLYIVPVSSTIVTDVIFPLVDGKIEFTDAKPILKVKGEHFHFTGDVLKKLKFKHYSNKLPKDFRNFHAFPKEIKLGTSKERDEFSQTKKFLKIVYLNQKNDSIQKYEYQTKLYEEEASESKEEEKEEGKEVDGYKKLYKRSLF